MTCETLVSEIGRRLQFFFIRSTSSRKSSICERLPKEHASGRAAGVNSPSGSKTFHAMEDFTDRRLRFAYRRNADATVDSICLQCFGRWERRFLPAACSISRANITASLERRACHAAKANRQEWGEATRVPLPPAANKTSAEPTLAAHASPGKVGSRELRARPQAVEANLYLRVTTFGPGSEELSKLV
jgi:hypothetical protein